MKKVILEKVLKIFKIFSLFRILNKKSWKIEISRNFQGIVLQNMSRHSDLF